MTRTIYLHGFASSPSSRKATFFREEFAKLGVPLEIPDLAQGDFRGLTIGKQLRIMEQLTRGEPVALIGSSLGGYISALYAKDHPEVERLVLLAPAFNFCGKWAEDLGAGQMEQWRQQGEMPVFHYGEQRMLPLKFEFIEEAASYDPFPTFLQPCMIFHGTQDSVVPVEYSEIFTADHPNVKLVRVQSGHELTDVLGMIWVQASLFILPGGRH